MAWRRSKTTGDAYMVVSGVPEPLPDHAATLADLALDTREALAGLVDPKSRAVPVRATTRGHVYLEIRDLAAQACSAPRFVSTGTRPSNGLDLRSDGGSVAGKPLFSWQSGTVIGRKSGPMKIEREPQLAGFG